MVNFYSTCFDFFLDLSQSIKNKVKFSKQYIHIDFDYLCLKHDIFGDYFISNGSIDIKNLHIKSKNS